MEDAEPVLQELDRVLERAGLTLEDQQAQEADLRDRLHELRQANNDADPFWLIIDISRSTAYTGSIREAKDLFLAKALNPQLTSWDRAIDPAYKVSEIFTRTGKKRVRPFEPPLPLLRLLQGSQSAGTGGNQEISGESGDSNTPPQPRNPSALQVPVEPAMSDPAPRTSQPPIGTGNRNVQREPTPEVALMGEMMRGIQEAVVRMQRAIQRMEEREIRLLSRRAEEQEGGGDREPEPTRLAP